MKKYIVPFVLSLFGAAGGLGAGYALRPHHEEDATQAAHCVPCADSAALKKGTALPPAAADYVKLNNQFVVPVVDGNSVGALVVLSLSIETNNTSRDTVYAREPKLRDAFLRVLFDHASIGGFDADFTKATKLDILRQSLTTAAQAVLGPEATGVLITDIARQEL